MADTNGPLWIFPGDLTWLESPYVAVMANVSSTHLGRGDGKWRIPPFRSAFGGICGALS